MFHNIKMSKYLNKVTDLSLYLFLLEIAFDQIIYHVRFARTQNGF